MLAGSDIVAFVSTTDAERARRFYADTLGLRLVEQTPYACVFAAPNATLRVTVSKTVVAGPSTVLGWTVADIGASIGALVERGVELVRFDGMDQDASGVWQSLSGARVAWFRDPDGNILSVTEL